MTTDRFTLTQGTLVLLTLLLAVGLGWVVWSLPLATPTLTETVLAEMPNSGVTNPVTAVLLNFRAYDTLLEMAVLFLAVIGVWTIAHAQPDPDPSPSGAVFMTFLRFVIPLMIMLAGYLLWIGASAPGGAFQAGALLGGGGVLLLLSDFGRRGLPTTIWLRVGLALGLAVFILAAVGVMGINNAHLLEYPRASAKYWILLIEAAAMVSIALTLAALFFGGRPAADDTEVR